MFLQPDLNRLAYLSRIDLTISEILQSLESLQSYVILHRAEKACYLPGWQINNFYVRPRQHPVNSVQGCLGVWQDGSKGLPLTGSSGPCWWIWGSAKLFLAVTVPKTLHLLWTIWLEYNVSIKISRDHNGSLT